MKRLLYLVLAVSLMFTTAFKSGYIGGTLKDNKSNFTYKTTDVTEYTSEVLNQSIFLTFSDAEIAAAGSGLTESEFRQLKDSYNLYISSGGTQGVQASILMKPQVLTFALSVSMWNYNNKTEGIFKDTQYKVKDEFKEIQLNRKFDQLLTKEYQEKLKVLCEYVKLDYLNVMSKWRYQGAMTFNIDCVQSGNHLAYGLEGAPDGEGEYILQPVSLLLTQDEINSSTTNFEYIAWLAASGWKQGGPTYPDGSSQRNKVLSHLRSYGFTDAIPKELEIMMSKFNLSNNEELHRICSGIYMITSFRHLVAASLGISGADISMKKIIDSNKDKIRGILSKETWVEQDAKDLLDDIVQNKLTDLYNGINSDEWKARFFTMIRMINVGNNDSHGGQGMLTFEQFKSIKEKINNIKDDDFKKIIDDNINDVFASSARYYENGSYIYKNDFTSGHLKENYIKNINSASSYTVSNDPITPIYLYGVDNIDNITCTWDDSSEEKAIVNGVTWKGNVNELCDISKAALALHSIISDPTYGLKLGTHGFAHAALGIPIYMWGNHSIQENNGYTVTDADGNTHSSGGNYPIVYYYDFATKYNGYNNVK